MNTMIIEYDNKVNNSHTKGYLVTPEDFNSAWPIGFYAYLKDKYKAENIKIYPYNRKPPINENTGMYYTGDMINLEDDFIMALRSTVYYPNCSENNSVRRQWAKLDVATPDFTVKERR